MPRTVIEGLAQVSYAACSEQYTRENDGFIAENTFRIRFFTPAPKVVQYRGRDARNNTDDNIRRVIQVFQKVDHRIAGDEEGERCRATDKRYPEGVFGQTH